MQWSSTYWFTHKVVLLQQCICIVSDILHCFLHLSVITVLHKFVHLNHCVLSKHIKDIIKLRTLTDYHQLIDSLYIFQAFSAVEISFTSESMWSDIFLICFINFFQVSLILLLSHCLFASGHEVLSGSAKPLMIHVFR